MVQVWIIVTIAYFATISVATPIKGGENVGRITKRDNNLVVFGHERYPYMVVIAITEIKNGKSSTHECGGVIIGLNSVLTAGHCLYEKVNPTGIIQAGIVDRHYEANEGQKIQMKDYLVHERYRDTCPVGKRCCYSINDIAIIWTTKRFKIGKIANLAKSQVRPLNNEGWIVGWGLNSNNKLPAMLQNGLVKVISNKDCAQFNPSGYIHENLICVKGVNKEISSALGDSGGPFVIQGIVYGISTLTLYSNHCPRKELSVYTYVPNYSKWIARNLREGPPKLRDDKPKPTQKIQPVFETDI